MKAQAHFVRHTPGRESLMSLVTVVRERPVQKLAPSSVFVLRFSVLCNMALRFVSKSRLRRSQHHPHWNMLWSLFCARSKCTNQ